MKKRAVPRARPAATDGRRLRSERSREQIVKALLSLIRAGHVHPSAAQVAEAAGVSLRTVFRHFDELDVLRREMSAIVEAEVRPLLDAPIEGRSWRARLMGLAARRATIYERVLPIKVAAGVQRFQSDYLMQGHRHFLAMERRGLEALLPASIVSDAVLVEALDMAMGFQAWRRLRQDQGLSVEEAECVMRFVVERLIAGR